jgi:lipopolysaccharide biosynthesis regulator YciM
MTQAVILLAIAVVVLFAVAYHYYRRSLTGPETYDPQTYIEGLKALMRGQDELAFTKLKETVSADTSNVDAYIHLGNIFRRKKKPEQALQVHRDLTFRSGLTSSEKKDILTALYKDFMEAQDESSAVKAIKEMLQQSPNDRFALRGLLRFHEKAGDWKEAASISKKLDKLGEGDSQRRQALYKVFEGNDLIEQSDPHRARLFFKEAIHLDKNCLAAYVAIGDSYYNEKRLEDALSYWTKVITLKPGEGQVVFERLKKGFFEVGRYGDYADTLTNLLQAFPEHLTARLELAYFMEKKGEKENARAHYTKALDNHPESMLAKLGL